MTKERQAWLSMVKRCHNPKSRDFPRYGGAGITVCPSWRSDYERFLIDVGLAPSAKPMLGRRDVTAGYHPANCVWTTHAEQMRRRKFCRKVTLHGQVMTAAEAARLPGQPCRKQVLQRQKNGLLFDNPPSTYMHPKAKWITHKGESLPLYEWAKRLGLSRQALRYRIQCGWPIDQALNPELRQGRSPSMNTTPAPDSRPAAKAAQAANR